MSIPSDHVAIFRTFRADRYVDTVDIVRLSTRGSINDTSLQYDSESSPTIASAQACLIRPETESPIVSEFGQEGIQRGEYVVDFPHDVADLKVDDRLTVTVSTHSPNLTGKTLIVTNVTYDTYQTHRRVNAQLDLGSGES